ncbi:MAG: bile acid:sodium symporter, partial [Rikenellaceae bacterium]
GYNSWVFTTVGVSTMLKLIGGMLALFLVSFGAILLICRWLKFSREDKITATFCGSKKSLVLGSVMIKILITNPVIVGIMLLPIMVFHVMQLIIISTLASHLNNKLDRREKAQKLACENTQAEVELK